MATSFREEWNASVHISLPSCLPYAKWQLRHLVARSAGFFRPVCLAYQPPVSSTFLSEQISHQQPASSTFLSEQISTSHQLPAKRTSHLLWIGPSKRI
jgi:hypothetical protein